jgi:multimeric flavodoxin WrbA
MKVTAIVGSPRRKGNSAKLVESVLEGARESGAETSIHYLGEKTIKPCTGCYSCEKTKECVIKDDDMAEIYADMESADAYVFASPVYFNQVSGQFKTFLDRIFPYYWGKPLRGKKAVFTLAYENSKENLYGHVVDWFTDMMEICHGIEFVGTLKVHGTGRNPVEENKEVLVRAKEMGRKLT